MCIRDQETPFEAAAKTIFQRRKVLGMAIGTDHDLLPRLVEAVEGVKELLEDLFLALEELDVVEEQHVDRAISLLELVHPLSANSVDELVEELLGRDVADYGSRIEFDAVVTDGMEEVGLAKTGVRVDEQGVVVASRLLGDGERCCVGETVRLSDDEVVECVFGNQSGIINRNSSRVDRVDREGRL